MSRTVTHARKKSKDVIERLKGDWGDDSVESIIKDIESKKHQYYVRRESPAVEVKVVDGANGKYLRASPDKNSANNLDNLPSF